VQLNVECDILWYENKVEIIIGVHSQNLLSEKNPEGVQKSSQKYHLQINVACVKMHAWKS
jgi:hypothetical protein